MKWLVLIVAVVVGCGGASGALQATPESATTGKAEGIPDMPDDTCPVFPDCWDLDEFADHDGCPTEPEIAFAQGSSEVPAAAERGLADMVAEIHELGGRLRLLRLAGCATVSEAPELAMARAVAVRDRLVALGVSPDILETTGERRGERGFVSFVVLDCDARES